MKTRITNKDTRKCHYFLGNPVYIHTTECVIRIHIKSEISDIFSFENEARLNELGLKEIGVEITNQSAYRNLGELTEYFIIPIDKFELSLDSK